MTTWVILVIAICIATLYKNQEEVRQFLKSASVEEVIIGVVSMVFMIAFFTVIYLVLKFLFNRIGIIFLIAIMFIVIYLLKTLEKR